MPPSVWPPIAFGGVGGGGGAGGGIGVGVAVGVFVGVGVGVGAAVWVGIAATLGTGCRLRLVEHPASATKSDAPRSPTLSLRRIRGT